MASIRPNSAVSVLKIKEFLGLNENPDGDTHIRTGELSRMENFRVTRDKHLQLRPGQKTLLNLRTAWDALAEKPSGVTEPRFRGAWSGTVGGAEHLLCAFGGAVFDVSISGGTMKDVGRCQEDETTFFGFGNKVYLLNGHEYLSWDGKARERFPPWRGISPRCRPPPPPAATACCWRT